MKQKVKAYGNPEVAKFESNVKKSTNLLAKTKNQFIAYYKEIGKLNDGSTESEINKTFSASNKAELARIQGVIDKNTELLKDAKATEAQWNKLDTQLRM